MAARRSAPAASIRSASRTRRHLCRVPRVHRSGDARLHAAFANHLRGQPDRRVVRHARGRSAVRVDAGQARQRFRVRSGSVAREPATSSARCRRFPAEGSTDGEGSGAGVPRAAAARQDRWRNAWNSTWACRSSDYEFSGRVETYKADGLWEPFKGFTFRGGFEHAIRAPNIGELYNQIGAQAQIGSPPGQGDPCDVRSTARTGANGAAVRDSVRRNRRSGADRRHLSIHHGRDRRRSTAAIRT